MQKILRRIFFTLVVLCFASSCFAMVTISDRGTWPDTWPQELERYRDQAKTFGVANGTQEDVHEIHFSSREEFEQAWPYILKVKSKSHVAASLEFTSTTYSLTPSPVGACVRVLCPPRNTPTGIPLWEADFPHDSADLPEYVHRRNNQWVVSYDLDQGVTFRYRARTDIVLIADGKIIDPQSATFPASAPRESLPPKSELKTTSTTLPSLERAAFFMYATYVQQRPPIPLPETELIPAKFWTDSIAALNPLRVYIQRINIVVVLHEENGMEEGKYISNFASSYSPTTGDDGFTFTKSEAGDGSMDFKRVRAK